MIPDPSPWSNFYGPDPEPEPASTAELVEEAKAEEEERVQQEYRDRMLWERYAARLTADGRLIR